MVKYVLLILLLIPQIILAKTRCPGIKGSYQYDQIILNASKQYKIDAALIHAVIKQESCYDRFALSRAGAEGLMQLMPATASRFNVSNAFIPKQNINAGAKYLSWLLKRFNGNVRWALAGYNAGEGRVDHYKGIPPFKETIHYVNRVMENYRFFRGLSVKTKPVKQVIPNKAILKKAVIKRKKNKTSRIRLIAKRQPKIRARLVPIKKPGNQLKQVAVYKPVKKSANKHMPTYGTRSRVNSLTLVFNRDSKYRNHSGYTRVNAKVIRNRGSNAS